jgi:hypothetical protein
MRGLPHVLTRKSRITTRRARDGFCSVNCGIQRAQEEPTHMSHAYDNKVEDLDSHYRAERHVTHLRLFNMGRTSDIEEIEAHASNGEYIVEKALEHRAAADGSPEFRIKWKDWPDAAATWEPAAGVKEISVVKAYAQEQGLALDGRSARRSRKDG